jgi:hypothetical protein
MARSARLLRWDDTTLDGRAVGSDYGHNAPPFSWFGTAPGKIEVTTETWRVREMKEDPLGKAAGEPAPARSLHDSEAGSLY